MSEHCMICECEPVDESDWYRCEATTEMVCPWCVIDMHNNKDRKTVEKIKAALSIYKENEFSREFIKSLLI